MNAEYKRENHKSYFVIKDRRLEEPGTEGQNELYGLKMICDNQMKGLLPVTLHTFNGEKELYYDISSKQSMRILYEKRELNREDLQKLFTGMQTAIDSMEEYLLDMECLIIDPDYIYINGADDTIFLLYYPFVEENFESAVYEFADYILERVCNEDEQAVIYAYGFYRYVKEEQGDLREALKRSLENRDCEEKRDEQREKQEWEIAGKEEESEDVGFYLDEEEEIPYESEKTKEIKKGDSVMAIAFFGVLALGGIGMILYSVWKYGLSLQDLFTVKEAAVGAGVFAIAAAGMAFFSIGGYLHKKKKREMRKEQEQPERQEKPKKQEEDETFYETGLYESETDGSDASLKREESGCETVLLQENCYREQRILVGRVQGRKKQIDLSSFPFIIGKSREQADYVLEDSSVSRLHARFTLRDDVVYLTDLNSTNGTTKNGIKLEPNELVMLEADDEIAFGRVTFTYH